ncbi:hypothetical protein NDU88_000690 [Pleurodeles waltl]|uniref:Uncharacterized protein n=1 Tax=Pleurodeles waltl TaxID=8319 RepID=A0AAV7WJ94_PLEWA|nr:hypothetical protein NDU88_000690 [Pleurodeles waltl]
MNTSAMHMSLILRRGLPDVHPACGHGGHTAHPRTLVVLTPGPESLPSAPSDPYTPTPLKVTRSKGASGLTPDFFSLSAFVRPDLDKSQTSYHVCVLHWRGITACSYMGSLIHCHASALKLPTAVWSARKAPLAPRSDTRCPQKASRTGRYTDMRSLLL